MPEWPGGKTSRKHATMPPSKQVIFAVLTVVLATSVTLLLAEGLYSMARLGTQGTSLTYRLFAGLGGSAAARRVEDQPSSPDLQLIADAGEFEALMDQFRVANIGIGNSPYKELRTGEARTNVEIDACLTQKPDLDKTMSFLRANLFVNFDPPNVFYDTALVLPPEVAAFIDRYAFRKIRLRSNGDGERLTIPQVSSPDKVLVAGDSVANGSMVSDEETIASQLQAADPLRQYVNIGVASAKASDVVCNLERAARRYPGQVKEIVYVFCENDFDPDKPFGNPDELIAWLVRFLAKEKIGRLTMVYVPYIYNSSPDVTRIEGQLGYGFSFFRDEKNRLLSGAKAAGFRVVDYLETTQEARRDGGSQFAALALYVDHTHLSRHGIARLVERLRDQP